MNQSQEDLMTPTSILRMFEINYSALMANLDGINNDEALILPKPAGSPINWVVGHIVVSRDVILTVLGEKPVMEDEESIHYKRGAKVEDVNLLIPLSKLIEVLQQSQDRLRNGLKRLSEEEINKPFEIGETDEDKSTLADQLSFIQFHEAYHVGQTGLLRRLVGKEGSIA